MSLVKVGLLTFEYILFEHLYYEFSSSIKSAYQTDLFFVIIIAIY